jgi:hypothetical protein
MPRKPIELPPAIGRSFTTTACAYRSTSDSITKDEIAARKARPLSEHLGLRTAG